MGYWRCWRCWRCWRIAHGGSAEKQRAPVERAGVQLFLDPEQLVVLGHAVRWRGGTGLDLAGGEPHGQIRDGGVFRLAAAVAGDAPVAVASGQVDGGNRLGQRADLVDLDEDGVGYALVDAAP